MYVLLQECLVLTANAYWTASLDRQWRSLLSAISRSLQVKTPLRSQ